MRGHPTCLLLRRLPEASQSCRPRAARYGLVGFLDLGVEVAGLRAGAALARLLLGLVLGIALLLYMVVCGVHAVNVV